MSSAGPLAIASPSEAEQVRALRRMKAIPLALLVLAASVYLFARHAEAAPDAWTGWAAVRATAEAGVVGGLADWFAVTALFRHPLGIPIPHTALIPRKKDQLGASLSTFVRDNFLQPDTVRDKVVAAEPGLALGRYLADDGKRARVVGEAAALGRSALAGVDDADIQLLIRNTIFKHATATALSPPLGRLLRTVIADRTHEPLVDVMFRSIHEWLLANRADLIDIIASQGPVAQGGPIRWMHEVIATRMYTSALAFVVEVRHDPKHRTRAAIDDYLETLAGQMQSDPRTIERVESWKLDLLEHEQTQAAVFQLWPTLRRVLDEALADPDSELRSRADDALLDFSGRLRNDADYRAAFDARAADAGVFLIARYGDEAVSVISDTVQRWDGAQASRRIELAVGRDLQFIRINGTVVGALVGLTIHTLSGLVV